MSSKFDQESTKDLGLAAKHLIRLMRTADSADDPIVMVFGDHLGAILRELSIREDNHDLH